MTSPSYDRTTELIFAGYHFERALPFQVVVEWMTWCLATTPTVPFASFVNETTIAFKFAATVFGVFSHQQTVLV
jgi:hypothetical protein